MAQTADRLNGIVELSGCFCKLSNHAEFETPFGQVEPVAHAARSIAGSHYISVLSVNYEPWTENI